MAKINMGRGGGSDKDVVCPLLLLRKVNAAVDPKAPGIFSVRKHTEGMVRGA